MTSSSRDTSTPVRSAHRGRPPRPHQTAHTPQMGSSCIRRPASSCFDRSPSARGRPAIRARRTCLGRPPSILLTIILVVWWLAWARLAVAILYFALGREGKSRQARRQPDADSMGARFAASRIGRDLGRRGGGDRSRSAQHAGRRLCRHRSGDRKPFPSRRSNRSLGQARRAGSGNKLALNPDTDGRRRSRRRSE